MFTAAIVIVVVAYLLGSIPTGYLMGRARGVDLRTLGSGNIGATNALRILGKPAGSFVLLVDGFKGWLGVRWIPATVGGAMGFKPDPGQLVWLSVLGGVAAVLGHNFTCWLRFKGGKGIATSAGVLAGLVPEAFLVVLGVFLMVLAFTRIVSLASLVAAAVLPLATWVWHRSGVLVGFSVLLAALAFWRHRANLSRLRQGTEPRIGQKRAAPPASTS